MTALERKDWARALTAHPKQVLQSLADRLSADCEVAHIGLPRAGLGLLTLRDGALLEPFYLGEFPLSSCHIELSRRDGRKAEGAAQIIADDGELAFALAVLDAVLAAKLPGWTEVSELVERGDDRRREEDRRRRALLASTKVDFASLAEAEDDDEAR
jgi:alpha-D-ribose 1-methylphosphonate 5-triphosphate synthase subunit PhnG